MIHYHGTPISPRRELLKLAGRSFCVSYAKPQDVAVAHQIGESVMLDNGAFSAWRRGYVPDWRDYYGFADLWLDYPTTWAVIPDVIDGDEADNDRLIDQWPHGTRGAPVWHMHESIGRLLRLCEKWPRVCLGSSGSYATVGDARWHARMTQAINALCGDAAVPVWLHMLRGMSLSGSAYPFASVDSTDIARNHNRNGDPAAMAERWGGMNCPAYWYKQPEQEELLCG